MTSRAAWLFGLLAALMVAACLSPWACSWPDGLDHVAETLGFQHRARAVVTAPLREYKVPGIRSERPSTAAAGLAGTLAVFGAASLIGHALRRRRR